MKVNYIESNNLTTPTTSYHDVAVVPYPELNSSYRASLRNVSESDPFTSGSFSSMLKKFERAYRLLFTPEVDKTSMDIKEGIDTLFENKKQSNLNLVA